MLQVIHIFSARLNKDELQFNVALVRLKLQILPKPARRQRNDLATVFYEFQGFCKDLSSHAIKDKLDIRQDSFELLLTVVDVPVCAERHDATMLFTRGSANHVRAEFRDGPCLIEYKCFHNIVLPILLVRASTIPAISLLAPNGEADPRGRDA